MMLRLSLPPVVKQAKKGTLALARSFIVNDVCDSASYMMLSLEIDLSFLLLLTLIV